MTESNLDLQKEKHVLVSQESMIKGGSLKNGKYVVRSEGKADVYEMVRIGDKSLVIRTREITENGKTQIMDYDPKTQTFVRRDPKESEFSANLKALIKTRETGNTVLWDGVDKDGKRIGGINLKLQTYNEPLYNQIRTHFLTMVKG
jgi:hypothetical protein